MNQPKVSVIVAAFNAEPWIADALESVFAQTYTNFEVVVVDDGSTDGTEKIVQRFGPLRYVFQRNSGVAATRNTGIANSDGELIGQLDADDFWFPDMLRELVPQFADPSVGLACSDLYFWNQQMPVDHSPRYWQRIRRPAEGADMWQELVQENFIPAPTTIIRRSILSHVGLYDETLSRAEDYDLWLRIARKGYQVRFVDRPLGVYRRHPGSLNSNLGARLDAQLRIGAKLTTIRDLRAEERKLVGNSLRVWQSGYRTAAVDCLLAGQVDKAREYFSVACHYHPHDLRNLFGLALAWVSPRLAVTLAKELRKMRKKYLKPQRS